MSKLHHSTTQKANYYILTLNIKMKKRRTNHETNSGMFADVAFLLLIFFMVVTTFNKAYKIQLSLPPITEDTITSPVNKQRILEIYLNDVSQIMVEDHLFNSEDEYSLISGLNRITSQKKSGIVKINMHPMTSYSDYISLLAQLKKDREQLNNKQSLDGYGKEYLLLTTEQKNIINQQTKYAVIENEITSI